MKKVAQPAKELSGTFAYRHYRAWPEDERWELIGGVAYDMSPAPRLNHQVLSVKLEGYLRDFLRGKPCALLHAPVDVLLPEPGQADDDAENVVQPDIVVVCDPEKLANGRYVRGAPDLVVEILSPSTIRKDMSEKFDLYSRAGVREYWIVEPAAFWLHRYVRAGEGGGVPAARFGEALVRDKGDGLGAVASIVLEGFSFLPDELFG